MTEARVARKLDHRAVDLSGSKSVLPGAGRLPSGLFIARIKDGRVVPLNEPKREAEQLAEHLSRIVDRQLDGDGEDLWQRVAEDLLYYLRGRGSWTRLS